MFQTPHIEMKFFEMKYYVIYIKRKKSSHSINNPFYIYFIFK